MGLELGYERLAFRRCEVENVAESVVEGSVTLPAGYPEVGRALRLRARPSVSHVEVDDERVVFTGVLDLCLLYVHFEEKHEGPRPQADLVDDHDDFHEEEPESVVEEVLHHAEWVGEMPFTYILEMPGVRAGQDVESSVRVKESSFEVRGDQVSVDVDVVLEFQARACTLTTVDVPSNVQGGEDVETKKKSVRIKNELASATVEAVAEGELSLGADASPKHVLSLEAKPEALDVTVDDGLVRVRGAVNYTMLYLSPAGTPHCKEWRRGLPFECEISLEGARRGARALVTVTAKESRYSHEDGEGGGRMDVMTPLNVEVNVVHVKEVGLITEMTSSEKEILTRHEQLSLHETVSEGSMVEVAEAPLALPDGHPGFERVLCGEARATVDDVHVLGDKVAVELHVDVEVLYVGRTEQGGGVYTVTWPAAFSLDVEVPAPGAEPGLERNVEVDVERVELDLINREEIDVKVHVRTEVELGRDMEVEVIVEAVEVPPAEAQPPTYTFVVIEPGETLWKLAARYRSNPDAIVAANDWLESTDASLSPGRKVCVPRKVTEPVA